MDSEGSRKRAAPGGGDDSNKRANTKQKRPWRVTRVGPNEGKELRRTIEPGDSGIWATCDKGREGKCIGELRDLFAEYAELLYADQLPAAEVKTDDASGDVEASIENEIQQELQDIRKPAAGHLFAPVRLPVQCVVFFKTQAPVDPVSFVHRICKDAAADPQRKRTRFTKRLSPMTLIGRASEEGLAKVADQVLASQFHAEPIVSRKFAIRPTLRNHNVLSRDAVIKQVAAAVGQGHKAAVGEPIDEMAHNVRPACESAVAGRC
ncbi:hypothetical protein M8818_000179 [Zalaria obscura]|uniref:Uncharacterized protein n=1 Tax=Zalaria obscura TaxID=2024903 RepID=A0ACC3SNW8_9PEZI